MLLPQPYSARAKGGETPKYVAAFMKRGTKSAMESAVGEAVISESAVLPPLATPSAQRQFGRRRMTRLRGVTDLRLGVAIKKYYCVYLSGEPIVKKLSKYLVAFFMAATLLSVVGCAATPKQEGTGEYVDDSVITTKVKAAILKEPELKVAEINVETFKGVVQLSGFVGSPAAANKAVEVARGVGGVKSVKNDMRIK